jgi:hypothetical protein
MYNKNTHVKFVLSWGPRTENKRCSSRKVSSYQELMERNTQQAESE